MIKLPVFLLVLVIILLGITQIGCASGKSPSVTCTLELAQALEAQEAEKAEQPATKKTNGTLWHKKQSMTFESPSYTILYSGIEKQDIKKNQSVIPIEVFDSNSLIITNPVG